MCFAGFFHWWKLILVWIALKVSTVSCLRTISTWSIFICSETGSMTLDWTLSQRFLANGGKLIWKATPASMSFSTIRELLGCLGNVQKCVRINASIWIKLRAWSWRVTKNSRRDVSILEKWTFLGDVDWFWGVWAKTFCKVDFWLLIKFWNF